MTDPDTSEHPNWQSFQPNPVQPWKTLSSSAGIPQPHGVQVAQVQTHLGEEYRYVYRPRGRGAVFVLPITASGEVVLIRQYRYPTQQTLLEVPAGAIDAGEIALVAGKRELLEETGGVAESLEALPAYFASPSFSGSVFYPFVAWDVEILHPPHREATELIETVVLPLSEVYAMLERGEILDGNACLLLFHARKRILERFTF